MKFLSSDEIIADLLATMSEEDKVYFANDHDNKVNEWGLNEHAWNMSSLGRFIRNHYHLWHTDNPYTSKRWVPEMRNVEYKEINGREVQIYSSNGPDGTKCDCSPYHPDNFSGAIVETLIAKLKAGA